jgi:hypothetical protein
MPRRGRTGRGSSCAAAQALPEALLRGRQGTIARASMCHDGTVLLEAQLRFASCADSFLLKSVSTTLLRN